MRIHGAGMSCRTSSGGSGMDRLKQVIVKRITRCATDNGGKGGEGQAHRVYSDDKVLHLLLSLFMLHSDDTLSLLGDTGSTTFTGGLE